MPIVPVVIIILYICTNVKFLIFLCVTRNHDLEQAICPILIISFILYIFFAIKDMG